MSMPPIEPTESPSEPEPFPISPPGPDPSPDLEPQPEPDQAPEPGPVDAAEPTVSGGGWTLISLIADDGQEPPAGLTEREALATWCAVSATWHPSLLARAGSLPRIESIDSPSPPGPNEVRVLPEGTINR